MTFMSLANALRWVVLVPASYVASASVVVILGIVHPLLMDFAFMNSASFLGEAYHKAVVNGAAGATLIWAATRIAPNHKVKAGRWMVVVIVAVLVVPWGLGFGFDSGWDYYAAGMAIAGAAATAFASDDKTSESVEATVERAHT